jgi:hypothetical protein
LLERAVREALAAGLLRAGEQCDAYDVLELLDAKLPPAEASCRAVGPDTGRLLLGEEILRLLGEAEDGGHRALTRLEVDERLGDKPVGTSIRGVLEQLRHDRLIATFGTEGSFVRLTREGRARARRPVERDPGEHSVLDAEGLLELIYRARASAGHVRDGDRERPLGAIWHVPVVQGAAGVSAERFAELVRELEARGLVGPGSGSYRTITESGSDLARPRFRERRAPGEPLEPVRLLPPVRRPRELRRRYDDLACPNCGRPASWLRTRTGRRYEELRRTGLAEYKCTCCDVAWLVYAEPVDRDGAYDPFGDPAVCRARWSFRGGWLREDRLAPRDHYV